MRTRLILLALMVGSCISPATHAARIILISEIRDNNLDGLQDDRDFEDFLRGMGYRVEARRDRWTTLDAAKIAELNAADLVVVSRSLDSDNYADDAAEIAGWNGLTAPMLVMHACLARGMGGGSQWSWLRSATIDNRAAPRMQVVDPAHPIFTGVPLDANNQVDASDGAIGAGQTSFVGTIHVGNGRLLARTDAGTDAWIVEWQPGAPYYEGSLEIPGGRRLLFCAGTQESRTMPYGALNLTERGKRMMANAVNYLLGITSRTMASSPTPPDGATDVAPGVALAWMPGGCAATHDVYLGTDANAVADAERVNPLGTLVGQNIDVNAYDPVASLQLGRTYYWRVDGVNAAPDFAVSKGKVWSFIVEPVTQPIAKVTATASSFIADMRPENTVNGSGLDANDRHSVDPMQMWLSAPDWQPTWIQFEFDGVYKLDRLLVWNSNQRIEPILGFGARKVIVSYSADGEVWTRLGGFEFPPAPGDPTCAPDATVDFAGAGARFVKLTITSNWGGVIAQYGLSEVRFLCIPAQPREPMPADSAAGVEIAPLLTWRPGREAVAHRVYFSDDRQAVIDGTSPLTITAENSFDPGALSLGKTYYWKVAEVNTAAVPSVWEGDVWSLTTREYSAVDDFESYNDDDRRIYETWIDGITTKASGSRVGYGISPFAEQMILHGGSQAMPLAYNNVDSPYYSEAEREFKTAQNWMVDGADTLNLWVRGYPPAYVEEGGVITMSAAGTGIWGSADDFRLAYKTLSGDGSILVKVESLVNTNAWAQAGVMIRQSLDADAKFVHFVVSSSRGVSMGWRPQAAATCTSATQPKVAAPQWVKLIRQGNVFTARYSADGEAWLDLKNADGTIASTTVAMTNPVYLGLCATSHHVNATTTAVMSGAATTGAVGGSWQAVTIGDDPEPANTPADLYVTIKDRFGKSVTAINPTVVTSGLWTQWKIPFSTLTGVNLRSVKKISIGVGRRTNPVPGGSGMLYIDDIGFGHPTP